MYENLDELLDENVLYMTESKDSFYVKLSKEREDDTMWKVDKKTGKVSYLPYVTYIGIENEEKLTSVNPGSLRKAK